MYDYELHAPIVGSALWGLDRLAPDFQERRGVAIKSGLEPMEFARSLLDGEHRVLVWDNAAGIPAHPLVVLNVDGTERAR